MTVDRGTDRSRTFRAVLAITALSLLVRLVGLGGRIFHWDEGRVGYWILRYQETGEYAYRPITHGPFLPIVNEILFGIIPVSDFAARLPVAVVGGLLPLAAWLFRDRLRDGELVAFALVLAANPLMVYYSRFMRSDVLVAAFSLVALGCFLRAFDAEDLRYLYGAAAAMALAFTTKENALLYLVAWLGAAVLLVDHRLLRATARGRSGRAVVSRDWPARIADRFRTFGSSLLDGILEVGAHFAGALALFVLVIAFFYAPRPDLWHAFGDPTSLPGLVNEATYEQAEKVYDSWITGSHQDHDYMPYLHDYLETLAYGAPVVVVFGLLGFVIDRYGSEADGYRELVAFASYWGVASVVGYPLATDIQAPWTAVHAVVPLAIPAAVGLAFVFAEAWRALPFESHDSLGDISADDAADTGVVALVLFAVLAASIGVSFVGANVAYMNAASDDHKQVLQWAQPENDLKETLETVRAVARDNEGTDVLFYGTRNPDNEDEVLFHVEDPTSLRTAPPGGPAWHSRLPLPWYLERYDASVTSTAPDTPPEEALRDAPPVVVAYDFDRDDLEPHLDGYTAHQHRFKLWGEDVVVFVDESAAAAAYQADG
jgi:uncharacterized protein (TIGR03663 family)